MVEGSCSSSIQQSISQPDSYVVMVNLTQIYSDNYQPNRAQTKKPQFDQNGVSVLTSNNQNNKSCVFTLSQSMDPNTNDMMLLNDK